MAVINSPGYYRRPRTRDANRKTALMFPGFRRPLAALLVVLAAVTVLAMPGRDRELASYDSAEYIVAAKGLATGAGYRTLNLPGPPAFLYPPVVPALLASVWHVWPVFPDNLVPMKTWMIALGIISLVIVYAYAAAALRLDPWEAVAVVALIGFHPLFRFYMTDLGSEIPYLLLSIGALYGYARYVDRGGAGWLTMALAGLALAFLARSIGVTLCGAMVLDALRRRRLRLALALMAVSAAVIVPWLGWTWRARSAYDDYPLEIAANYRGYVANLFATRWLAELRRALPLNAGGFAVAWTSWILPWTPKATGIFAVVMTSVPALWRIRRAPRAADWYCAGATAMVLLWPWPLNDRFVLVLSPFLLAYWIEGLGTLTAWRPVARWSRPLILGLVVSSALVFDAREILAENRAEPGRRAMYAEFHDMLRWIDASTAPNAMLVGANDAAYYLYSGRRALRIAYPDPFDVYYDPGRRARYAKPADIMAWLRRIKACYVVHDPLRGQLESSYNAGLIRSLAEAAPGSLTPVYASESGSFKVFRLSDCGGPE